MANRAINLTALRYPSGDKIKFITLYIFDYVVTINNFVAKSYKIQIGTDKLQGKLKMTSYKINKTNHITLILIFCLSAVTTNIANAESKEINSAKDFVKTVDSTLPTLMKDYFVPGVAIAIIQNGQVVTYKLYGYANLDKKIPVDGKTGFNIGSISKTVAAWGVMRLVEQGKISLDEPVEKYLTRWHLPKTEFNNKGVTIRRLLSHTAGLSLHGYPGWGPEDQLPSVE